MPSGFVTPAAGGGSQPVTCVLACDAGFDIHAVGSVDAKWDALYDNLWDLDPLVAIPAGLGLTFAFNGSAGLVAATATGAWALSYFGERAADENWSGSFVVGGVGLNIPWAQAKIGTGGGVVGSGIPYMAASLTAHLPSGTQLTHQVSTTNTATSNPSLVNQIYLSIVRLA